ncbi:hypothetical protein HK097_005741 [Rhizophlyctis rosea]|uniref:Uncharacterized protein n=1 Tax=Rhizophlyctis rosea TaxID=64517 RepID=A0AAD5RZZ1_9FUNG|nr:hypothetical protein HK097_005741 [Rhizophlyctis rosea]
MNHPLPSSTMKVTLAGGVLCGNFLRAKNMESQNAEESKKADGYRIGRFERTGLLRPELMADKDAWVQVLAKVLTEENATSKSSFEAHINGLNRMLNEFTEADMIRAIDEVHSAIPKLFRDEWDDAKKVARFKDIYVKSLEPLVHNSLAAYDATGLRGKGRGERKAGRMTEKQSARYIPYPSLVAKFTALEETFRRKTSAADFLRYCIIVGCLTTLLGDRALRCDIGAAAFGEGTEDADVRFVPEVPHMEVKKKCKTGRKGDQPTIITFTKSAYLRECLERVYQGRLKRGENQLFLKQDGDGFETSRKHWRWFGDTIIRMCKSKAFGSIGEVGITAMRLSLAVHLHQQHRELMQRTDLPPEAEHDSVKAICLHMDHLWETQVEKYALVQHCPDEEADVEVASETGGSEQGDDEE